MPQKHIAYAVFVLYLLVGCRNEPRSLELPSQNSIEKNGHQQANQPACSTRNSATELSETDSDPLVRLNDQFRAIYRQARDERAAAARPVILVQGDKLTLLLDQSQHENSHFPPRYHWLKAVAHVPLAIDVCLIGVGSGELDEDRRLQLVKLREFIESANSELAHFDFEPEQRARQSAILSASLDYLRELQQTRRVTAEKRINFARVMRPLAMQNVEEAAHLRIDAYHSTVCQWRQMMDDESWAKLKVVILGAALPRARNLAVQYFAKLLGEPGEGGRILYAESIFTPEPALELLGTHLLDRQIAIDFFSDPKRMHRDILSDATTEYLNQLDWNAVAEQSR